MSGQHTPAPWSFSAWHIEEGPPAVRAPAGHIVATTASDDDAAFIVQAVNSYDRNRATIDALVGALEFYADPKRYKGPNQRAVKNDPYAKPDDAYLRDVTRDGGDIARAALQLARGSKGDE